MVFKAWFELILLYHKLVLPSSSNVIIYIEIIVGFFIFFLFMQNQNRGMCEICLWKKKREERLVLSLSLLQLSHHLLLLLDISWSPDSPAIDSACHGIPLPPPTSITGFGTQLQTDLYHQLSGSLACRWQTVGPRGLCNCASQSL